MDIYDVTRVRDGFSTFQLVVINCKKYTWHFWNARTTRMLHRVRKFSRMRIKSHNNLNAHQKPGPNRSGEI